MKIPTKKFCYKYISYNFLWPVSCPTSFTSNSILFPRQTRTHVGKPLAEEEEQNNWKPITPSCRQWDTKADVGPHSAVKLVIFSLSSTLCPQWTILLLSIKAEHWKVGLISQSRLKFYFANIMAKLYIFYFTLWKFENWGLWDRAHCAGDKCWHIWVMSSFQAVFVRGNIAHFSV